MGVSRSGYYKWLNRDDSKQESRREEAKEIITKVHNDHPSHGYRWVTAFINYNYSKNYSPGFVYSAFRALGIKSLTKHKEKPRKRKERDKYPNLIFSTWETVDRPRQVIVSDMTCFYVYYSYYELTMYFDVFTKQIVAARFGRRRGDRMQYIDGLIDVIALLEEEGVTEPVVIHTDQGSVYASMAYNELIKDKNINRSMSRPGKPTDNPVNESLNGWIKEELFIDFKLDESQDPIETVKGYIKYYNSQRPSWALNYDIPDLFYEKYMNGEMEHKDTFNKRVLTEVPKYVLKKMSTSKNENDEKNEDVST
jgi:transposase InsO family protein